MEKTWPSSAVNTFSVFGTLLLVPSALRYNEEWTINVKEFHALYDKLHVEDLVYTK